MLHLHFSLEFMSRKDMLGYERRPLSKIFDSISAIYGHDLKYYTDFYKKFNGNIEYSRALKVTIYVYYLQF